MRCERYDDPHHEQCKVYVDLACQAFCQAAEAIAHSDEAHPEYVGAWREELLEAIHQIADAIGAKQ